MNDEILNNLIYPNINFTITSYGDEILKYMLHNYTDYVPELQQRQDIISSLLYKQKTRKTIKTQLINIQKYYKSINWLLNEDKQEYTFFFSTLNYKQILSFKNYMKIYAPFLILITYFLFYILLIKYGYNVGIWSYIKGLFMGYRVLVKTILSASIKNDFFLEILTNFLAFLYLFYQLFTVYNSLDTSVYSLQKYSKYKTEINNIRQILNSCKILSEKFPHFFDNSAFLHLQEKFSSTNIGNELYLSLETEALIPYFNAICNYIGYVDAYLCITNLIITRNYTFAIYDNVSRTPFIDLVGTFDISGENLDSHNLSIGNPDTLIITGNPENINNYVTSIMVSLYLAQTLTIAPCNNLTFTPLRYENIPQNNTCFIMKIYQEINNNIIQELINSYNSLNFILTEDTQLLDIQKNIPNKFKNIIL